MADSFNNLHEFMLYTKSWIYVLIVLALIAIGCFWKFLSSRDEE